MPFMMLIFSELCELLCFVVAKLLSFRCLVVVKMGLACLKCPICNTRNLRRGRIFLRPSVANIDVS